VLISLYKKRSLHLEKMHRELSTMLVCDVWLNLNGGYKEIIFASSVNIFNNMAYPLQLEFIKEKHEEKTRFEVLAPQSNFRIPLRFLICDSLLRITPFVDAESEAVLISQQIPTAI